MDKGIKYKKVKVKTNSKGLAEIKWDGAILKNKIFDRLDSVEILDKKGNIIQKATESELRGRKGKWTIANLPPNEEQTFTIRYASVEGQYAKETLIKRNLRLVVFNAKKYRGRGIGFDDLIADGNIGLIKGIEKFNWKEGYRISTYVM